MDNPAVPAGYCVSDLRNPSLGAFSLNDLVVLGLAEKREIDHPSSSG